MDKQKEIEELASLMADCNTTCDKCFEKLESVMTLPIQKRENYCQVYAYAQRAVEQGYRKTFTSDLASDTQKAFKEGYIKATIDRGNEIAELKAENAMLKRKYEALKVGKSVASGIAQIPNEINERIIKSKVVKDFAEKLKEEYKALEQHYICMYDWDGHSAVYECEIKIDELLKEYEE